MKDCYYDLGLHFILLDDSSQSYILKLRDRLKYKRLAQRVDTFTKHISDHIPVTVRIRVVENTD